MILLSGATGKVGSAACLELDRAGVPFRVLVRDRNKFALKDSENAEILEGDLENEADVKQAMRGVTKAFLLMANHPGQMDIEQRFASIAEQSGVQHLVKISSLEASPEATATLPKQHYQSEQFIRSLNLAWTFLRPNFYMQNMLMYSAPIKNANLFALPLGDAKTAMVDTRDVGAVVAKVLREDGHANKIYKLAGSELVTFDEVAQSLSTVLGKEVKYVRQTAAEFRTVLEQFIASRWQLDAVCELFGEIASGSLAEMTDDVSLILNRSPLRLAEFAKDYSEAFS